MANNHVIDPTFFYQCIEQFSFDFVFYRRSAQSVDSYGEQQVTYTDYTIRGSLQSKGKRLIKRQEGNIIEWHYDFYCKSLYRIDVGDLIIYKNKLLRVEEVNNDYDEYGVRGADLVNVEFSAYQDLLEYLKYKNGSELV